MSPTSEATSMSRKPGPSPDSSTVPLLGEGFSEAWADATPVSSEGVELTQERDEDISRRSAKRRIFGLGKGKDGEKSMGKVTEALGVQESTPVGQMRPTSPCTLAYASSPTHPSNHPYQLPSSPNYNNQFSSPRVPSPASSQIFERNVQDSALPTTTSPAIPLHIQTENHIPPVLEASSLAITDNHLDPDNVEIVMHSAHQPAALTVTGSSIGEAAGTSWQDDLVPHPDNDDAASNYGALDANDVRRLSFISFADVVQSEHTEHTTARDSMHLSGILSASAQSVIRNRSPSPARSPESSHGLGISPPASGSASLEGLDSPFRLWEKNPANTGPAHSAPTGNELTIETMRQALRKTGSGDLSGAGSQPLSAIGADDA
ncbi:MAG: hypothetical protein M1835_004606 [Candelina submexicana]|nr:MAG: hypothetical protein M1835_004606 [Candelina submexicana]